MRAGRTALSDYQRLEAPGLWRAAPEAQRREVIVSVGEASLVMTDQAEKPLAHWSLAALERRNPGKRPALYAPGPDAVEDLEIADPEMIEAVERVRRAVLRARPHPGRLRARIAFGSIAAFVILALVWLPDVIIRHTARVAPEAVRAQIGAELLSAVTDVAGRACRSPAGTAALAQLKTRVLGPGPGTIQVMPDAISTAVLLPGRIVLLGRPMVEDHETPEVAAGFILAEVARAGETDPLLRLLDAAGVRAAVRVLTTGTIAHGTLESYAEFLLTARHGTVPNGPLLAAFERAGVRATPYAYAVDISGESTLALIEADPIAPGEGPAVLSDDDWVALQGICGT